MRSGSTEMFRLDSRQDKACARLEQALEQKDSMLKVFDDGDEVFSASDGVKLFYHRAGHGSQALVFLHGWGGSSSYWNHMMPYIDSTDLSLICMDLRGHGRSDHTRRGFTTARFGDDVLELAEHLQVSKLIVVGYSMSARWSQWICCSRPENLAGQILIAPVPALALSFPGGMVDDWIQRVSTREGFHAFEGQFMAKPILPDLLDDCFDAIATTPEHTLRETLRMCIEESFVDRLSATCAPTIVIGGTEDPMGTPEYLAREIVQKIPNARLSLLPCGHNLPLEMPLETAGIINDFVSQVLRASALRQA
jgi:pimeloyl-ACP methyl ester carboxylesterase